MNFAIAPLVLRRGLTLVRHEVRIVPSRKIAKPTHCDAHMNELPIPCGPWKPWYDAKQSYYTKWLILGILSFLGSFALMVYSGSFFLNWGPPLQPGPPTDMVEECEEGE